MIVECKRLDRRGWRVDEWKGADAIELQRRSRNLISRRNVVTGSVGVVVHNHPEVVPIPGRKVGKSGSTNNRGRTEQAECVGTILECLRPHLGRRQVASCYAHLILNIKF